MNTESFKSRVQAMIDAEFEYQTRHPDAGDAYAHLPREGAFDYDNGTERLAAYMKEHGIDACGVDMDQLAEDCLFWAEMVPGAECDPQERFLACSFNLGETEHEIDAESIGARFTPWLIEWLNRNTDACWRYDDEDHALFYLNCDGIFWDCVISKETIRNCVSELAESSC